MNLATALDIGKDVAPIRFSANPQEDLRHLIFTSGSTGAPKAVMRSDAHATSASDTHVLEYQVFCCCCCCCCCFFFFLICWKRFTFVSSLWLSLHLESTATMWC
jgi:acyl-CoA synthetase (AMP-forming)/AMP-acid ligase II